MRIDPEKNMNVEELITAENLLFLALEAVNLGVEGEASIVAYDLIHWYIFKEFQKQDKEFTEDDVQERFYKLLSNHLLDNLIKKGYINADLTQKDIEYSLTDSGKDYFKSLMDGYMKKKDNLDG